MTSDARAFFAVDEGTATTAAALIARPDGRWRLLGSNAFPAAIPTDPILALLVERLRSADPSLAAALGADDTAPARWARVAVRSRPSGRLAVVAASERALLPYVDAAVRSGWRVTPASAERLDPLAMTRLLLDPGVEAILCGAGEPPGADERPALDDLGALVAAAAERRPGLAIVLAGAIAGRDSATIEGEGVVLAPAPVDRATAGALQATLGELRAPAGEARRAITAGALALAEALGRRVEVVEIGVSAGTRIHAAPGLGGEAGSVLTATIAPAGLTAEEREDVAVDGLLGWSTIATDRHRLRDRFRELRTSPWGDSTGDGALLRMAAARAALARLVEATPEFAALPPPDVVVVAGGVWAVAPGPAIALAVADVLRRPAAIQVAYDHAHLLGPLGSIEDDGERRRTIADLVDDLLVPLGSVVIPQGMRSGRSAGRVVVHGTSGTTELDLVPGGLELIDLPPGETAVAEFEFRDAVRLGTRGRHFAVDVAGGLGGLLVDLRDVPLRLPDRLDRRRELLAAWQSALWAGIET